MVSDTTDDDLSVGSSVIQSNPNRSQPSSKNKTIGSPFLQGGKYKFAWLILLLGVAVSVAFMVTGAKSETEGAQLNFQQRATEIVFQVEASWNVYSLFAKWVRESCHRPDLSSKKNVYNATPDDPLGLGVKIGEDPSHALGYCSFEEFDKIYDYVISEGLSFQALQFLPNITHAERPYFEAYANSYYQTHYPGLVKNQGIMQFVEDAEPGKPPFAPTEDLDFYFPVVQMRPIETNLAAVFFNPYSRPPNRICIDKAVNTWQPVVTGRIKLIQDTDPSAYSVILHHPGTLSEHEDYTTQAPAISQIIIRIPDLLVQSTKGMKLNEALYLYDATPDSPMYLGAAKIAPSSFGNQTTELERIPEVELADIPHPRGSHYFQTNINVADRVWTVAIISTNEQPNWTLVIVGGIIIFLASALIAVSWYHSQIKVLETMTTTYNLLSSVFPGEVRDRLLKDAIENKKDASGKGAFKRDPERQDFMGKEAGGDAATLSMSKTIADLTPEATVLFADIAGFTAWSSTREPAQVFTLLENVFHTFDTQAKRYGVFKVETVGDCYVAVCGLPEPRKDHAVAMVRFARGCSNNFQLLARRLEVELGPDTGDLGVRIGMHSGPVTSGVLRGERPRFQLFGDTMNTASRIETTGQKNRIHLSKETADLIIRAGKQHWIQARSDKVFAKGLGELQTYWCDIKSVDNKSVISRASASSRPSDAVLEEDKEAEKIGRLVDWNASILLGLLKSIEARRRASKTKADGNDVMTALERQPKPPGQTVFDETVDVIELPLFDSKAAAKEEYPRDIVLDNKVEQQLTEYIKTVSELYRGNAFHSFEHANHVIMSTVKLLSRIVAPSTPHDKETLHDHTYGITSDPLTQFAVVFSALIHDIDHPGVTNSTLVTEGAPLAKIYKGISVAEQNSVDLAWKLLMDDKYVDLRRTIYTTETEFKRFRQLIVNTVMATDVMDKKIGDARKVRWNKAFSFDSDQTSLEENQQDTINRRATIVLEHLIQASDVAHTMQHWHIFCKWNQRLFDEMYLAYKNGRAEKNPAEFWYEGEKGFLDFYVIPLAKKLKTCGVFGVSSDEYLNYAIHNRMEWETKGHQIVTEMVNRLESENATTYTGLATDRSIRTHVEV